MRKATDYTGYVKTCGMFALMSKAEFVKYNVERNLNPISKNCRAINGGQVGNRHALKRGIRMWNYCGEVILRGNNPVTRESYSPSI